MNKEDNLIGIRYNKLTVISELESIRDNSGSLRRMVECVCDCGNIVTKKLKYLKSGETTTCGNCVGVLVGKTKGDLVVFKVDPLDDENELVGKRFGRLLVETVGFRLEKEKKKRIVEVKCDCGSRYFIKKNNLLNGHSTSCGCLVTENAAFLNKSHGFSTTETYACWHNMVQRCENPNNTYYYNYGGRGITVCEKWKNFEGFLEDMGVKQEGLTLERVNVNLGYSKDNCTWATRSQQSINRRKFKSNTSGKTGVYYNKNQKTWVTNIAINSETIHLGTFKTIEEAISVRQAAELKYFGFIKE